MAVQDRHVARFVEVAMSIAEMWASPRGLEAMAVVEREWGNLRAALTTALARVDVRSAELILDATFGPAVMNLQFEHGEWAEGTVALASDAVRVGPPTYGYAASFAWRAGEYNRAIELAHRGIDVATSREDPSTLLCWAYLVLAAVLGGLFSDAVEAAPNLTSVASRTDTDPLHQLAASSAFLLLAAIGDRSGVGAFLQRIESIATEAASPPITAVASFVLGVGLGIAQPPDLAAALDAFDRSLRLARELRATHMVIGDLMGIAEIKASERMVDADEACRAALTAGYEARSWAMLGTGLVTVAKHLQAGGDIEGAAVVLGHVEAREPGAIAVAFTKGLVTLDALPGGSEVERWKATGSTMDRHQLVRYALESLGAPPEP